MLFPSLLPPDRGLVHGSIVLLLRLVQRGGTLRNHLWSPPSLLPLSLLCSIVTGYFLDMFFQGRPLEVLSSCVEQHHGLDSSTDGPFSPLLGATSPSCRCGRAPTLSNNSRFERALKDPLMATWDLVLALCWLWPPRP